MFRRLLCLFVLSASGMLPDPLSEAAQLPTTNQDNQRTESSAPDTSTSAPSTSAPTTAQMRSVVAAAFGATHEGWSSDEVILSTTLNHAFIAECQKSLPDVSAASLNWALLNLRKSGGLKIKSTKRNSQSVSHLAPIAEIAARSIQDRQRVTIDRIMTDPDLRSEFDAAAAAIEADVDPYSVRKSAFQLRKQRRLKPELITRIADWGRELNTYSLPELKTNPDQIPEHPGIYIFRDSTGYLYIGQSEDLRQRLKEHLDESSNFSLGKYLADAANDNITIEIHAFAPDSRAQETMIRRAYESELIASRKPKFNIQP